MLSARSAVGRTNSFALGHCCRPGRQVLIRSQRLHLGSGSLSLNGPRVVPPQLFKPSRQANATQRGSIRAQAGEADATATFSIRVPFLQLGFGDVVKLVGEQTNFGSWSVSAAPSLAWTEGHNWVGTFELSPDTYQFKVVIVRPSGNHQWENGDDRLLQVSSELHDREVVCTFNHTAEMPVSAAPAPKEEPQGKKEDTMKAQAVLQEMQASQPALQDVQPEQLGSVSAEDLGSTPQEAEADAEKLEMTQAVAAAAGFADEAPRQPPATDELEAASAFVTGESSTPGSTDISAPEAGAAAVPPPQEPEPEPEPQVVASEPEPEPEPAAMPEPEPEPEAQPAAESQPSMPPVEGNGQESSVNIEGTPISVAFDGTMTFSFDEGDTTDDAATLAAKLIPDLPDVSSMGVLGNGNGASEPQEAAKFAADFAESKTASAAAVSQRASGAIWRSPARQRHHLGSSRGAS